MYRKIVKSNIPNMGQELDKRIELIYVDGGLNKTNGTQDLATGPANFAAIHSLFSNDLRGFGRV